MAWRQAVVNLERPAFGHIPRATHRYFDGQRPGYLSDTSQWPGHLSLTVSGRDTSLTVSGRGTSLTVSGRDTSLTVSGRDTGHLSDGQWPGHLSDGQRPGLLSLTLSGRDTSLWRSAEGIPL